MNVSGPLQGALPMGSAVWEHVRILNGVPRPGAELTEAVNPLEAGLYHAVSLAKGCYIGQETLAKVHNNNGVLPFRKCRRALLRRVWRVAFPPENYSAGRLVSCHRANIVGMEVSQNYIGQEEFFLDQICHGRTRRE